METPLAPGLAKITQDSFIPQTADRLKPPKFCETNKGVEEKRLVNVGEIDAVFVEMSKPLRFILLFL